MTALNVLQLQPSSASGRATAKDVCTLKPGAVVGFSPRTPMALRITEGHAWVTLDDGPHGANGESAGDVFLQAGQTLWVADGQHAVVEPVGRQRVLYRWTGLAPRSAPAWWRQVLGLARAPSSDGAPCCA